MLMSAAGIQRTGCGAAYTLIGVMHALLHTVTTSLNIEHAGAVRVNCYACFIRAVMLTCPGRRKLGG